MKLLEVQSSVRLEQSISRALSREFIQTLQKFYPDGQYRQRDVGMNPPAHPTELWATANYTPSDSRTLGMETALTESEQLIEELLWANRLVFGVPMYNFCVPSTFKAYVDNIVRVNRTFAFDPENFTFQGLATDKKALVISPSAGNFAPDTPMGSMNFCETYSRSILGFIGIEDITIVAVPNQFMPDGTRQQEVEQARGKLVNLAASW
jgi:FMN-dependent NADH-azoreductase